MKVAIIGTVGVPANYGGFETLVENIIKRNFSDDIQYSVYCSSYAYKDKRWVYKGAKIVYIPLKANGIQSILYDMVSVCHAICKADVLLVLGVSGCIILPLVRLFSKKNIIVNIDGLEHRRAKWSNYVKKFLKFSETLAVKYATHIVSDNKGIQDYVLKEYGKHSELIEYGGDHVLSIQNEVQKDILEYIKFSRGTYSLALCRVEPENNVELILNAYAKTCENLVFVGNWNNSEFGKVMVDKFKGYLNIVLLSPIYDLKSLYALRANCKFYIHGHSAGGTNPSLVEAMYFGHPIFAFDVIYNRETTENKAAYFCNEEQLISLLNVQKKNYTNNGIAMLEIAQRRYLWSKIADAYEQLYYRENNKKRLL